MTDSTKLPSGNAGSSSRRDFLKAASLTLQFYIVPRHVLGKGYTAPSDKLNKLLVVVAKVGQT
jgi:hypothetical protein